jgi:hypothetical protein
LPVTGILDWIAGLVLPRPLIREFHTGPTHVVAILKVVSYQGAYLVACTDLDGRSWLAVDLSFDREQQLAAVYVEEDLLEGTENLHGPQTTS